MKTQDFFGPITNRSKSRSPRDLHCPTTFAAPNYIAQPLLDLTLFGADSAGSFPRASAAQCLSQDATDASASAGTDPGDADVGSSAGAGAGPTPAPSLAPTSARPSGRFDPAQAQTQQWMMVMMVMKISTARPLRKGQLRTSPQTAGIPHSCLSERRKADHKCNFRHASPT